jgi:anti-sigma factor RsiW
MTQALADDDRLALNALVDEELDAATAAALLDRVAAEPALRVARDALVAGRAAVQGLPRPEVSRDFLRRIELLTEGTSTTKPNMLSRVSFNGWRAIAAAMILTAFASSGATYLVFGSREPSLLSAIADDHRRSLLAASPVDVLSSDRHTVKPWLDAKLGVSPPAPDMAANTYSLVGGRVEVLGQQAVPALVYRHSEHTITVVAMPGSTAIAAPHLFASGGYNMVQWSADGFGFTAVSDLETGELETFVAEYQAATGTGVFGR